MAETSSGRFCSPPVALRNTLTHITHSLTGTHSQIQPDIHPGLDKALAYWLTLTSILAHTKHSDSLTHTVVYMLTSRHTFTNTLTHTHTHTHISSLVAIEMKKFC